MLKLVSKKCYIQMFVDCWKGHFKKSNRYVWGNFDISGAIFVYLVLAQTDLGTEKRQSDAIWVTTKNAHMTFARALLTKNHTTIYVNTVVESTVDIKCLQAIWDMESLLY